MRKAVGASAGGFIAAFQVRGGIQRFDQTRNVREVVQPDAFGDELRVIASQTAAQADDGAAKADLGNFDIAEGGFMNSAIETSGFKSRLQVNPGKRKFVYTFDNSLAVGDGSYDLGFINSGFVPEFQGQVANFRLLLFDDFVQAGNARLQAVENVFDGFLQFGNRAGRIAVCLRVACDFFEFGNQSLPELLFRLAAFFQQFS
ncbi:MAG: hypothetical protein AAB401_19660, partial [Acidobacteriota bacterium]